MKECTGVKLKKFVFTLSEDNEIPKEIKEAVKGHLKKGEIICYYFDTNASNPLFIIFINNILIVASNNYKRENRHFNLKKDGISINVNNKNRSISIDCNKDDKCFLTIEDSVVYDEFIKILTLNRIHFNQI